MIDLTIEKAKTGERIFIRTRELKSKRFSQIKFSD